MSDQADLGAPALADTLALITPLSARLNRTAIPAAGSEAARDGRYTIGQYAYDLSVTALRVSVDHLEAWQRLGADRTDLPTFAYFTLIRTALEGATFARWLCQPGIAHDDRLTRGVGAQWKDLEERKKLEEDAGPPDSAPPDWRPAAERQKRLLDEARKRGLLVENKKKVLVPMPVPDRTKLFEKYLFPRRAKSSDDKAGQLGRVLYRILSATAHGHQYLVGATTEWGLVDVAGPRPDSRIMDVRPRESVAAMVSVLALRGVLRAFADVEQYAGRS